MGPSTDLQNPVVTQKLQEVTIIFSQDRNVFSLQCPLPPIFLLRTAKIIVHCKKKKGTKLI